MCVCVCVGVSPFMDCPWFSFAVFSVGEPELKILFFFTSLVMCVLVSGRASLPAMIILVSQKLPEYYDLLKFLI